MDEFLEYVARLSLAAALILAVWMIGFGILLLRFPELVFKALIILLAAGAIIGGTGLLGVTLYSLIKTQKDNGP